MQPLLAIAWLTWKAAFRFRLFVVVALLLLAAVVALPILIKDDGTARGFTQILLTYTLTTISALLGLSTLWLACGTLARDIEECQIQMLAVKPIARWQIWLGKWLGLVSLDALLLALAGGSVFFLLQWRAARLPPKEREILRNEVLVARGSAREPSFDKQIDEQTDRLLKQRIQENPSLRANLNEVRKQIREQVKATYQVVLPGYQSRPWRIPLGLARYSLRGQPLFLRFKFNTADNTPNRTYLGAFRVGVPQKTRPWPKELESMAPDTFHEIELPPDLFDEAGVLTIVFGNPNDTALLFPLEDGLEVLYRQGGFGGNFIRGLGIILCWMALLAAVGLASASFLSFPVAAFFSLGLLTLTLSSGMVATVVEEGSIAGWNAEKGGYGPTPVDFIVIPVFRAVLKVIHLASDFSPVDALSTGRSITWLQLARALAQTVLLLGGLIGGIGTIILTRRELATAQGTP